MRTYSIVAMNYLKTEADVAALQIGTPVTLVREPNNIHDRHAVAVWANGKRVGYVPKTQNLVLAQFIDQQPIRSMAMDSMTGSRADVRAVDAKFVRSPNSGYPQVEL
jgi:hypothetical protein